MIMRKAWSLAVVLLALQLVLLACAPAAGDEPAASESEAASALSTARPTRKALAATEDLPTATTSPELTPMLGPDETPEDKAPSEGTGQQEGEAVSPSVVDLSDITARPPEEEAGEPVEMPQPGSPDPAATMANRAVNDLANRRNLDVSEISIVEVEEVEWRSSALGCPQPNARYLEVVTPGYRILLEAGGETYDYRASRQGALRLCEDPAAGVAPPKGFSDK